MTDRPLVPVRHYLQLHAAAGADAARAEVERYAQRHGQLGEIAPDPAKPYRPGDHTVAVVATIYEPAPAPPAPPVRWDRIVWALVALVLAVILLIAAIVDVYLLVGALVLTGGLFVAHQSDKGNR
jgi:hypothetical protein